MIHTILDTDLYKFTTSYAYIKLFPYAMGTFSFKDRDDTAYTDRQREPSTALPTGYPSPPASITTA